MGPRAHTFWSVSVSTLGREYEVPRSTMEYCGVPLPCQVSLEVLALSSVMARTDYLEQSLVAMANGHSLGFSTYGLPVTDLLLSMNVDV